MQDKFVVPQFIDNEGKIVGPLVVRQFLILIVDLGLIFVAYKTLTFYAFVGVGIFLAIMGGILAFLKVNGRPIQYFFINLWESLRRPKVRIWKQRVVTEKYKVHKQKVDHLPQPTHKRIIPKSRLSQLALTVDTGGRFSGEATANLKVQTMDLSEDKDF